MSEEPTRRRRRRRKRKSPGGAPRSPDSTQASASSSDAGASARAAGDPPAKKRRRRRRKPDGDRRDAPPEARPEGAQRRQRTASPPPAQQPSTGSAPRVRTASVDTAWDDEPDAPEVFDGSPSPGGRPSSESETYGVDDDEPPRELHLEADLPEAEDADDEPHVLDDEDRTPRGVVTSVASIRFHSAGRLYDVDTGEISYEVGDEVMVDSAGDLQLARVAIAATRQEASADLPRIARRATAADHAEKQAARQRSQAMLEYAKQATREHRVKVKMFQVDLAPDGKRAVFYFASEDRVDVRAVVRDLVGKYRVRIEMRQVGARDEAKLVGGIGDCGRELCCTTWLPRFEPVSIRMAKNQQLSLNPQKVTGQCGRLKCCLVYEDAQYRELGKGLPKQGKRVQTPAGIGRVAEVDILRQRVRVGFEGGDYETFPASVCSRPPQPGARAPAPDPVKPPE